MAIFLAQPLRMSSAAVMRTGADPRASVDLAAEDVRPINLHDPKVPFEEYMYYASITRAEEKIANEEYVRAQGPKSVKSVLMGRFSKGNHSAKLPPSPPATDSPANEKEMGLGEKSGEATPQAQTCRSLPPSGKQQAGLRVSNKSVDLSVSKSVERKL